MDGFFPFALPAVDSGSSSVIVACDGTPLRAFADENGVWRYPVTLENVSPYYLEALINYEDRFFRYHPGFNPLSLIRATWQWVKTGEIVSGGSTLTMQVARLVEPHPKSIAGKARQIFRAIQLEMKYTKPQILNYYLNHAPFGGTVEGIQAAAFTYLGKSAMELSRAEAALLAVLPQAPTRFRPDLHPAAAQSARNKVLHRLANLGIWPEKLVAEAETEPLGGNQYGYSHNTTDGFSMTAPILARRLKKRVKPGYVRRTTIDPMLQQDLEQRLAAFAAELPERTSMAILVVENKYLAIRAYVGSIDFFDNRRFGHVDMVEAIRSPGSTLKPFLYGFAMEDGLIHSESLLTDAPISFEGYHPENFSGKFMGPVSVSQALQKSLNIPAVQVLDWLSPEVFAARLHQGGLQLKFPESGRPNLSMILGGVGTSLESLVAAYSAFARKGLSGNLRFFEDAPVENRYMMSEAAAWIIRHILENNSRPGYDSRYTQLPAYGNIAWKTGTSYGFRDAWAIGVNNGYTLGVWVGRPDGTPVPGHYGAITALPVMLAVFDTLPVKTSAMGTKRPENVHREDICWPLGTSLKCGMESLCHVKKTAWIIGDHIPPTFPDRCLTNWENPVVTVTINPDTGKRVVPGCDVENPQKIMIARWPMMLEAWLTPDIRKKAIAPPLDPSCKSLTPPGNQTLKISGLSSGTILRKAGNTGNLPRINLSVQGAIGDIFWIINGELIQKTDPAQIFANRFETPGNYEITALDTCGNYDCVKICVMD